MKKHSFLHVALAFLLCSNIFADEPKTPEAQLSEAGVRRLEENKQIILKNIETVKTNIQNCQSNIETLEKQTDEVSKIENELIKLKEQYETFLGKAAAEGQKNREALALLIDSKGRKLASPERLERETWAKDTADKVAQVNKLLQKLNKDFSGVQIQKKDLISQKNHWTDRQKHHEKNLEALTSKHAEILKRKKG